METSHILERGKNCGHCEELVGKVLIHSIYVNSRTSKWSNAEIEKQQKNCESVSQFLLKCAREDGVHLSIYNSKAIFNYDAETDSKTNAEFRKEYIASKKVNTLTETLDASIRNGGYDNIAFLFMINDNGRSYSISAKLEYKNYDEHSVIRRMDTHAILHETLHIFGAADFYYPEKVSKNAKLFHPKSVMLSATSNEIDNTTRYLIGWHKNKKLDTIRFFNATADVTADDVKAALDKEWQNTRNKTTNTTTTKTSTNSHRGKVTYANGDVYEGEIKNDMRDGYGVQHYANGDIYTGNWKLDKRNGKGALRFKSGTVIEGIWSNNVADGIFEATYKNGKKEKILYNNNQIVKR